MPNKKKKIQPARSRVTTKQRKQINQRMQPTPTGMVLRQIGKTAGSIIGSRFGPIGSTVGGLLGHEAGGFISRLSGHGDYTVTGNTIVHPNSLDQIPAFGTVAAGTRVRHREYIGDVRSSQSFVNTSYSINPSNDNLFPWLSTMAELYEQWLPLGIVLEYKSLYSDAVVATATNASLGAAIMATEYNALANRFVNKQQMENTQYVTSAKPSHSFLHPIECARSQTPTELLYVRPTQSAVLPGDARLYDLGNFQFATQGNQVDGDVIGELWITYDIVFYKPVLTQSISSMQYAHFNLQDVQASITAGSGLSPPGQDVHNDLQVTIDSGGIVHLPPGSQGYYFLLVRWAGVASTLGPDVTPILTVPNNVVVVPSVMGSSFFAGVAGNGNLSSFASYIGAAVPPTVQSNNVILQLQVADNSLPVSFSVQPSSAGGWPNDASFGDLVLMYVSLDKPQ